MVKEGSERAEKFSQKHDPDVIMLRWKALRDWSLQKFWIPSWQHYLLDKYVDDLAEEYKLEYGMKGKFNDKLKKLVYQWNALSEDQKQLLRQDWIAEGLPADLFDEIPNVLKDIKTYFYMCVYPLSFLFSDIIVTPTPYPTVFPKEEDYVLDFLAPEEKEMLDIAVHALGRDFLSTLICAHNVTPTIAVIFPAPSLTYISLNLYPTLLRDLAFHIAYDLEPILQRELSYYIPTAYWKLDVSKLDTETRLK